MEENKDLREDGKFFEAPQDAVPDHSAVAGEFTRNTLLDVTPVTNLASAVHEELGEVIVGQREAIDLVLIALLSDGHILLEGVPGIAKTLLAKLMAKTMDMKFSRIQFTPDLMPADVIGTTVFDMKTSEFYFKPGPIFGNVILVDEINRAPAKTQAAMFEVMEERQITVDGKTYALEPPFVVLATQNPIEQEGTYKLPEAQLDRFLFKINMTYPDLDEEKTILKRFHNSYFEDPTKTVNIRLTKEALAEARKLVQQIHIQENLLDYIAELVNHTRTNSDLYLGASPRASLGILAACKAHAGISGRDFVTPDDIQAVAYPVLNHRIILNPDREMEGYQPQDVIRSIIKQIEVPR